MPGGQGINLMGDTSAQLDLAEKLIRIASLEADLRLKELQRGNLQSDTNWDDRQRAFLPWQFMLSALTVAFTAGAGLAAGVFALARWKVG